MNDDDPFQIITSSDAGLYLACLLAFCLIFHPYF